MALISLIRFPAISSTLQTFQICIFNRKNSKLTFSNGSQLMGKGLLQICMHHWTVYAKVEFSRFPPDVRTGGPFHNFLPWTQKWIQNFSNLGGVHSTTVDPKLRNELKKFSNPGKHPFHNFWSWTQKLKLALISFMGFPPILSALQTFQICIFNRKIVN